MSIVNTFFLIFIITIFVVRIFLFIKPTASPTISRLRLHHYMYGLICIIIGLLLHWRVIYAIGLGLFVDELTYILIGGKTHKDNYSKISLIGTVFFIIIVFMLRNYLSF